MTASLSVVIPSVNGWGDLAGCLEALATERTSVELEVLVVDRVGEALRAKVREHFPWVRIFEASEGTTIPDLRAIAVAQATADAVAVIEDHILVPAGWSRMMLEAQAGGAAAVGGAVENRATERWIDRAAFLCEYSHLLPPLPEGQVASLAGNNVVYRREVLEHYRDVLAEGRWENHLHDAMKSDGLQLISRPDIRVGHKKHYTMREYVSQRFLYSRSYAGGRTSTWPAWRRFAYGMAALGLPAVLLWRVLGTIWRKGVSRWEILRVTPLLVVFVVSWGLGEVVGSWAGQGDALSRVC
jgi:hypothetical protein